MAHPEPDAVPELFRGDPLIRMKVYRLALSLSAAVPADAAALRRLDTTRSLVGQLSLAVASIGANVAEGYSRPTAADRARFFGYALGSGREARHFYVAAGHALSEEALLARAGALDECIRLLVAMINRQQDAPRLARR